MADEINFLSSAGKSDQAGAAGKKPQPASDELAMHVPSPEAPEKKPEAPPTDFLGGLKELMPKAPAGPAPDQVFKARMPSGKLEEPVLPKKTEPPPVMKPAPPPTPPPPPPKIPPKPPSPPKKENGGTLRVSLISTAGGTSLTELAVRDRVRTFILVLVLSLVVNALIYGGVLLYKAQVIKSLASDQAAVQSLDKQIADEVAKTAPARNLQLLMKNANEALKNHRHWTNMLAFVEDLAKPDVQFNNMSGTEDGGLAMTVVAKDYTTLAKQILVFKHDPRIKKVAFGGASGSTGAVSTTVSMTVDPDILLSAASAISATSTRQ